MGPTYDPMTLPNPGAEESSKTRLGELGLTFAMHTALVIRVQSIPMPSSVNMTARKIRQGIPTSLP